MWTATTKAFVAGFGLLAALNAASAEQVSLRLAYVLPEHDITYKAAVMSFVNGINNDPGAKGVIEIVPFPNGALGRIVSEQAQMVLDGAADIAVVMPAFSPGRFPELEVFELPALFDDMRQATSTLDAFVEAGQATSLAAFFPVMTAMTTSHIIHTTKPVTRLADLEGKKLRASGAPSAEGLKALGAVPVSLATTELPESLGRGTVEGVVTQTALLYDMQMDRIVANHYNLEMGSFMVTMLMSRQRFDGLPPAAQEIIQRYSGGVASNAYNSGIETNQTAILKRLADDASQTMVQPTDEDLAEAKLKFEAVYAAWAQKRPENAGVLDFVRQRIAEAGAAR